MILLMFGVGLHFSLKDLMAVKSIAIPGAIAQIGGDAAGHGAFGGAGLVNHDRYRIWAVSFNRQYRGVLRALEERQLIDSQRGQIAIGWLIVEDLVMVLTLVLLPAVAGMMEKRISASPRWHWI